MLDKIFNTSNSVGNSVTTLQLNNHSSYVHDLEVLGKSLLLLLRSLEFTDLIFL